MEMGHEIVTDINENQPLGYTLLLFMIDNTRQSSAYSYFKPVKNHINLQVFKNILVTKIILDVKNSVVGVESTVGGKI